MSLISATKNKRCAIVKVVKIVKKVEMVSAFRCSAFTRPPAFAGEAQAFGKLSPSNVQTVLTTLTFYSMQREALLTKAAMHITQLINAAENIRISHRFSLVAAPLL